MNHVCFTARIVAETDDWARSAPEALQRCSERLAAMRAGGAEIIH